MNIDEACALLDKTNHFHWLLTQTLEQLHKGGFLRLIERKGSDLVEVVHLLTEERLYPIVDKRLGLVLGLNTHSLPLARLFQYHYRAENPESSRLPLSRDEASDCYVIRGYGYFISSTEQSTIIVGATYRPDAYDKDLFLMYKLDRISKD